MTAHKEFHINQFLSVRLERGQTMIYIAGQRFIQCKHLILDIPVSEINVFEEIDSIDDATEKVGINSQRNIRRAMISPEVEFWGHCSNLQAWYEHDYDTRILHSNLAFALLGKLAEVGDPLAKKVFKSELVARYESGTDRTREYIIDSGALKYFSEDEVLNIILDTEDLIALIEMVEEVWTDCEPYIIIQELLIDENMKLENKKIYELDLSGIDLELEEFPKSALRLKNLKKFVLNGNYFKIIPDIIDQLNTLKELILDSNEIFHIPDSICKITSLERLEINGNKVCSLPNRIGDLKFLRTLGLGSNEIIDLPESFFNLKSLETLFLGSNKLEHLPELFCNLKSLKWLDLSNNNLMTLPECIINLHSLEYLDVSKNPLTENPELIEKIKKLRIKKTIVN